MVWISRRAGLQLMLGASQVLLLGAGAAGQVLPRIVSQWKLDETSPGDAVDAGGNSPGQYTDPELGLDPLLADGGTSVGFNGTSTDIEIQDVTAFQLASYSIVCYIQFDGGPNIGSNQVFLSKDSPALPGGLSLEIYNDGGSPRLRGYTRDSGGAAIWIGPQTGVETLALNAAYRVALTVNTGGARLYLNDTEVASSSNSQGLQSNSQPFVIGSYRGFTGWIDGAMDELRLYDGALTGSMIQALPQAQSINHQQPQLAYTVPVVPSVVPGNAIYVAVNGNDTTGNGSIGSPYRTIAKALSVAANGNTIVLRKGTYRGEASLNVTVRNLTIKGYRPDIEANPLNPANWPIIDGCHDPSGITWELVDSGRQEYRTAQTNLGAGTPQGMVIAGPTHQFPRWEPLGGYKNPTPMYRLFPYNGTSGERSVVSFRDTGTVAFGDLLTYYGPGTYRESDGRIHVRLQPVDPSMNGGEAIDAIPDKDPNNNQVFLWQKDSELFASLSDGFKMQGVFVRGYDRLYHTQPGRNNIQLTRNVFWMGAFQNYWFLTNTGMTGFLFQHNILEGGLPLWVPFRAIKSNLPNGGANYGRVSPFNFNSGGTYGVIIQDNIILGISDLVVATDSGIAAASALVIRNNCLQNTQDMEQCTHSWSNREVAYNFIKGVLASYQAPGNTMPNGTGCKYHHNLIVTNHLQLDRPGERLAWEPTDTHGSGTGWRAFTYYNTIIVANPTQEGSRASRMERPTMGYSQSGDPHESWNNIYILYNRDPSGGGPTTHRHLYEAMHTNEPTKKWLSDGNGFFVVKDATVGADSLFKNVRSTSDSPPVTFNSLSDFKNHSYYRSSIGNYGYADGMETNSVQGDPNFVGLNVEKLDIFGFAPSAYRPKATNYTTGAVDLSPTGLNRGWPGTSVYEPWRGALDPDGDGSEVGPREAV